MTTARVLRSRVRAKACPELVEGSHARRGACSSGGAGDRPADYTWAALGHGPICSPLFLVIAGMNRAIRQAATTPAAVGCL